MIWALLALGGFSILLVIYWLTEKPSPEQFHAARKSRMVDVHPRWDGTITVAKLEPPTDIGALPYVPPPDEHWEKLIDPTKKKPE